MINLSKTAKRLILSGLTASRFAFVSLGANASTYLHSGVAAMNSHGHKNISIKSLGLSEITKNTIEGLPAAELAHRDLQILTAAPKTVPSAPGFDLSLLAIVKNSGISYHF